MTIQLRMATDGAHQSLVYMGYVAYALAKAERGGGFHALTLEERTDLRAATEIAGRQMLRALAIVAELNDFAVSVNPYIGGKKCACGKPARWSKHVVVRAGTGSILYLCDEHMAADEEALPYTATPQP